jgi:hypothetical protein
MNHTPGPYRILRRSDKSLDYTHDGKLIIVDTRQFFIASIHADADEREAIEEEEQRANALLIAAAPDLLAALEAIATFRPDRAGPITASACSDTDYYIMLRDYARSALAKAKGA